MGEARRTCFVMGNSYGHELQAHLLYPVSDDTTSRFAHVGQNSILFGSDAVCARLCLLLFSFFLRRDWLLVDKA
jgi:hypothetical protein